VLFQIVVHSAGAGWQVGVFEERGNKVLPPRQLDRVGAGGSAFPLPPRGEVNALDPKALHYPLCAGQEAVLRDVFGRIVERSPRAQEKDVEAFGRYLFATLLGENGWQRLTQLADKEPLELALLWTDQEHAFSRLPWEMMHGPQRFLAEMSGVAITRRVLAPDAPPDRPPPPRPPVRLTCPPRVLFVVGTDLTSDDLRPGAEYLGLLQGLEQADAGLRLKTALLLQATPQQLTEAVASFRPTVVHFICHGGCNFNGQCYLQLTRDKQPKKNRPKADEEADESLLFSHLPTLELEDVFGPNLIQLLQPNGLPLPQVVVLNACYTAASLPPTLQDAGQVASPLAVELIRGGVPVVVGMAGEVADRACRLFTRRFYESLLKGGEIAQAAAQGRWTGFYEVWVDKGVIAQAAADARRAGIIALGGADPRASVDWALPLLVLPAGVNAVQLDVESDVERQEREKRRQEIAGKYAADEDYPAFCDRLELFRWYSLLLADASAQKVLSPKRRAFQLLSVAVTEKSFTKLAPGSRFGRTWLLHQLALQAARDGHVPCLVYKKTFKGGEPPKRLPDLLDALEWAGNKTAENFGVAGWSWFHLATLRGLKAGENVPQDFPNEIRQFYKPDNPGDPRLLAKAWRLDLLRLRDLICADYPVRERRRARLLLLIDDVHRMAEAIHPLLYNFLDEDGLQGGRAPDAIRAVFTYSSLKSPELHPDALRWIEEWKRKWVVGVPLDRFQPPEDRLAYKQFLLNWRTNNHKDGDPMPLVLARGAREEELKFFFKLLSGRAKGVPSLLESDDVADVIASFLQDAPGSLRYLLREANDEEVLREMLANDPGVRS
jgi:hypothetical protein